MIEKQQKVLAPSWSVMAMNSYISTVNKKKDANLFRQNIRRLALALDEEGARGWTEIAPNQIWRFFKGRPSWHYRGVESFLNFIGLERLAPLAIERNVKRILDASQMELPNLSMKESVDAEAVNKISTEILMEMKKVGYSKTCLECSNRAYLDLFLFLEANNLPYTKSLCSIWYKEMRNEKGKTFVYWNHSIDVLVSVVAGMSIDEAVFELSFKTKHNLDCFPDWAKPDYLKYKSKRENDGIGSSALNMDFCSIRRFSQFLDSKGIEKFEDLTVSLIKEYHTSDGIHKTLEGKNAYMIRIKGFLSFLAEEGKIQSNISLSLSCSKAKKVGPVTILTKEQLDAIEEYIHNASSPKEIRNSLIVGMGLYLGLRGCDIVNARISDIDWDRQELSIIQKKTKKYIRLPMPVFLSNLAYRYISDVRPDRWHCNNILLNTKAPYKPYNRSVCLKALNDIIGDEISSGFHILRRTFASELLRNTVAPDMIAEALGHSGLSSIDKYITTDEKNLRRCLLPMEGV